MAEKKQIDDKEFDKQFADATKRGEIALREEPRAVSVRYDKRKKRVVVDLNTGATYIFPPDVAQGLSNATENQLSDVKILGHGFVLEWTSLDVHFSVKGLMSGVFGSKNWMANISNQTTYQPVRKVA